MQKQLGFIGLGKMGKPMVNRLLKKKWRVFTYDVYVKGNTSAILELVQR
ncbi:MAG: NAD(P)-binding domain-containing protein, partial [bacterium]|nr:NAD(P)-binding domain-containing protein [bacterium]